MKKRLVMAAVAATSLLGGLSATAALGAASHGPATSDPCVIVGPLTVPPLPTIYVDQCLPQL